MASKGKLNLNNLLNQYQNKTEARSKKKSSTKSSVKSKSRSVSKKPVIEIPKTTSLKNVLKAKHILKSLTNLVEYRYKDSDTCPDCDMDISKYIEDYRKYYEEITDEIKDKIKELKKLIEDEDEHKLGDYIEELNDYLNIDSYEEIDNMFDEDINFCCLRSIFHSIENGNINREIYVIDLKEHIRLDYPDINRQMYPKCPGCGNPVSAYLFDVENKINEGKSLREAVDEVGLDTVCCRKNFLIDVIYPENKVNMDKIDVEHSNNILKSLNEDKYLYLPDVKLDDERELEIALRKRQELEAIFISRGVIIPTNMEYKNIQENTKVVPIGNGQFTLQQMRNRDTQ